MHGDLIHGGGQELKNVLFRLCLLAGEGWLFKLLSLAPALPSNFLPRQQLARRHDPRLVRLYWEVRTTLLDHSVEWQRVESVVRAAERELVLHRRESEVSRCAPFLLRAGPPWIMWRQQELGVSVLLQKQQCVAAPFGRCLSGVGWLEVRDVLLQIE